MAVDEQETAAKLQGESITIAYGQRSIVEDLDLIVPARRFTVLIGPNGSGKSSILRTFSGLMAPFRGAVLLDGRCIAKLSTKDMARRVGVLLQGAIAPEGLTVRNLISQGRYPHRSLFGRWSTDDQAALDEAMALTGMTDLADRELDSLSGGQRQCAWIAMVLAQETDVLLLDEPTTYLDLEHQIELMKLITTLVRHHGKTVVAVLHDINQASRYAEQIVILNAGRIAAVGRPEDVISTQLIADVFKVKTVLMKDPVAGTPLCIPL